MIGDTYLAVLLTMVTGFECVNSKNLEPSLACGKVFTRGGRIVKGRDAYDGEVPWMVSIRFGGSHRCGGSILNKRWILTAGHCFFSDFGPEHYTIRVGEYDYANETERHKHFDMAVDKIEIHPQYASPHLLSNDIALVKLKGDIVFDKYTWPICVDDGNINLRGKMTSVAGWGSLHKGGDMYSGPLQLVKLPVMENKVCQERFFYFNHGWVRIEKSHICTGYEEGGKDACEGDSGGPQFVKEGNRHTLVGVVAAGISCGMPGMPAIFSRVSHYLSWIEKSMKA